MPAIQVPPCSAARVGQRLDERAVEVLGVRTEVVVRRAEVALEDLGQHDQLGAAAPQRGETLAVLRGVGARRRAGRARCAARSWRRDEPWPPACHPGHAAAWHGSGDGTTGPMTASPGTVASRPRSGRRRRAGRRDGRADGRRRQGRDRAARGDAPGAGALGDRHRRRGRRGRRRRADDPSGDLHRRGPARRRTGRRAAGGAAGVLPPARPRASCWPSTCRGSGRAPSPGSSRRCRRTPRRLAGAGPDGAMLVGADGRRQPLCAVYRYAALQRARPATREDEHGLPGPPARRRAATWSRCPRSPTRRATSTRGRT